MENAKPSGPTSSRTHSSLTPEQEEVELKTLEVFERINQARIDLARINMERIRLKLIVASW